MSQLAPRARTVKLDEPWGTVTPTQVDLIKLGYHPGSGRLLMEDPAEGLTCGGCFHLFSHRKWFKCDEPTRPVTFGPATDLKKKWPACIAYTEDG